MVAVGAVEAIQGKVQRAGLVLRYLHALWHSQCTWSSPRHLWAVQEVLAPESVVIHHSLVRSFSIASAMLVALGSCGVQALCIHEANGVLVRAPLPEDVILK